MLHRLIANIVGVVLALAVITGAAQTAVPVQVEALRDVLVSLERKAPADEL